MPAPAKYTSDDLSAIVRLPLVNEMMRRPCELNSTDWDVPDLIGYSHDYETIYIARILPHWPFNGAPIPVKRFLLLRASFARALEMAFAEAVATPALSDECERLCMLLRMTGPDDNRAENIATAAKAAELYAVEMCHGPTGVASYTQWLESLPKIADDVPPDLAGDYVVLAYASKT